MLPRTRVLTAQQLRTLEAEWIKHCGSNWGSVLMEIAGLGAAHYISFLWRQQPGTVTIFCGRGNNGGDGLVIARHLHRRNIPVTVFMVAASGKKTNFTSETETNRALLTSLNIPIKELGSADLDLARQAVSKSSVVVDALLGTGLDRPVEGIYKGLIDIINTSGRIVCSVDIPSGINSDTGKVMGQAVRAHGTVTFGYLKAGLITYPGAEHSGSLTLIDIGLPRPEQLPDTLSEVASQLDRPVWQLASAGMIESWLPRRNPDSHKGTFGRVMLVAGSSGMSGAAVLAGKSALRSGAGLVVLATARSLIPHLPSEELIYHPLAETADGTISTAALEEIQAELAKANALILGPGISNNVETVQLVQNLANEISLPTIIDADGLNAIAAMKAPYVEHAEKAVFTPHPKELSRLLGESVADIQANRIGFAVKGAKRFGCIMVLKGARTVVASPDEEVFIIPTGNSGMATAGSGDVLSGIIGSFLAQGMSPLHAAVSGAYVHGLAGDLSAEQIGQDGTIAGDISEHVPDALLKLRTRSYKGSALEQQVIPM